MFGSLKQGLAREYTSRTGGTFPCQICREHDMIEMLGPMVCLLVLLSIIFILVEAPVVLITSCIGISTIIGIGITEGVFITCKHITTINQLKRVNSGTQTCE